MATSAYGAEVLPREGSALNFRLVAFSCPSPEAQTKRYRLEVASGKYDTEDLFKKNIVLSRQNNGPVIIAELPSFGQQYTWRITFEGSSAKIGQSGLLHFSVLPLPVECTQFRLVVTTPAKKYADAYVLSDASEMMFNMKGEPVWFMPPNKKFDPSLNDVRDMKVSEAGSITFLGGEFALEINYAGKLLWEAPRNGDAAQTGEGNYHHVLTRMRNGSHFVMGTEMHVWKRCKPGDCNGSSFVGPGNPAAVGEYTMLIPFTTLIEYDSSNKVVWKWSSFDYLKNSDIFFHASPDGYADVDAHANSFYPSAHEKKIYVSFKNINRVIVISYPDGKVIGEYGERFSEMPQTQEDLQFSEQHSVRESKKGTILVFNNNSNHASAQPSVIEFMKPDKPSGPLKKLWEFACPVGNEKYEKIIVGLDRHGGKLKDLPDGSMFVSNCSPFSNIFIVSKDKKILWEAVSQKYNADKKNWAAGPSYRGNIITSRDLLEKLILRGESE